MHARRLFLALLLPMMLLGTPNVASSDNESYSYSNYVAGHVFGNINIMVGGVIIYHDDLLVGVQQEETYSRSCEGGPGQYTYSRHAYFWDGIEGEGTSTNGALWEWNNVVFHSLNWNVDYPRLHEPGRETGAWMTLNLETGTTGLNYYQLEELVYSWYDDTGAAEVMSEIMAANTVMGPQPYLPPTQQMQLPGQGPFQSDGTSIPDILGNIQQGYVLTAKYSGDSKEMRVEVSRSDHQEPTPCDGG